MDVGSEADGVPRCRQTYIDRRRTRLGRREGGGGAGRFHRARHVRQLLHRPRGREGCNRDRRATGEAPVSVRFDAGLFRIVMAGFVPVIHLFLPAEPRRKTWMRAKSADMTSSWVEVADASQR